MSREDVIEQLTSILREHGRVSSWRELDLSDDFLRACGGNFKDILWIFVQVGMEFNIKGYPGSEDVDTVSKYNTIGDYVDFVHKKVNQ